MLIREGDQLIPKNSRLGRLSCGKRRQADNEKCIRKGMVVAELPRAPERLLGRLVRLIGVAPMPECWFGRPDTLPRETG